MLSGTVKAFACRAPPRVVRSPGMRTQAAPEISSCINNFYRWSGGLADEDQNAIPLIPLLKGALRSEDVTEITPKIRNLAKSVKFSGKKGDLIVAPDQEGKPERVFFGVGDKDDASPASLIWAFAALSSKLPRGLYKVKSFDAPLSSPSESVATNASLGWILGSYKFDRYKKSKDEVDEDDREGSWARARLVWPEGADRSLVRAMAEAFFLARDLINTPAEDMGPQHLITEATELVRGHEGAVINVIQGEELLDANYPAIHTVGRASARPPALIDIRWSCPAGTASTDLPLVALVGKGVCFDTGGLNIKSGAGMKLMKKDMGGGAFVLALAHVIMSQQLPVRLRVLVPAVENNIGGNAYRPSDVLRTRLGITVENGNTDAEGRLILCDALCEAASEEPDLLLDCATLTGAARAALGPELPAVFCNCNNVWSALNAAGTAEDDPMWRLPLVNQYRKMIDSKVADVSSTGGEGAQGGAIIAALFLREFVKKAPRWVHMDTSGWTMSTFAGPGRPEGGEALGLRAVWAFLHKRYGKH